LHPVCASVGVRRGPWATCRKVEIGAGGLYLMVLQKVVEPLFGRPERCPARKARLLD